jgi:ribosomal-protein-alanine N-acetyltransferase
MQRFYGWRYGPRVQLQLPDPPLSDGIVRLRPWRPGDAEAVVAAFADPVSVYWMHQVSQPYGEQDALAYVDRMNQAIRARTGGAFAVADAATDEVAGSIGFSVVDAELEIVEIGYWAAPAARGRGVATRALRLLSTWLLGNVGAQRVQIRADIENVASLRVAEKSGFSREGVLRSSGYNPRAQRRIDYVMFSLLPGEDS